MSTVEFPIRPPSRPPGYLERQGYVKPLWKIMLRRSDVTPHLTYVPDDEAYNLPALTEKLESDKYSVSTIDHVTVELTRTDELVDFLKGLKEPKYLRVRIFSYLLFRKHQKQLVWFGLLQNLPEGIDAYPWDKLKLTFMSPPGAWEDGDAVKDPDTGSAYRNKHVTDVLLPAFIKEAHKQAKGSTREGKFEPPVVRGDDYFWSGLDRPRKKLTGLKVPYDDTCKVTAMCWDSTSGLLYLGVHDGPGTKTLPWLVSYDPVNRKWAYVTRFKYTGSLSFLWLSNTGWEVQHLESSGGKLYFVCRTDFQDILEREAHYKCRGEIDLNAVPGTVALTDGNLFTLHDKGISIRSRHVHFQNNSPVPDGDDNYYANAYAETIGWGCPRSDVKEAGVLWEIPRHVSYLRREYTPTCRNRTLRLKRYGTQGYKTIYYYCPTRGQRVILRDKEKGYQQYLGVVQNVKVGSEWLDVVVEKYAEYEFDPNRSPYGPYNCPVNFHWRHNSPAFNVFIAEPQDVQLEYILDKGFASYDPVEVYVEARLDQAGRDQFYWPDQLGEISETSKFRIDRVGYASFISARDLEETGEENNGEGTDFHYWGGWVAPYKVTLQGYNPAFLIEDGFWVASGIQDQSSWRRCQYQAGKCRLVHNGKDCVVGSDKIATYGKIFLYKDDSGIYCAWNGHAQDGNGRWFTQCKVAKWREGHRFRLLWTDRTAGDWYKRPESYITSFIHYKGKFYLGRKYYEPNWVDTKLRIFWAAPPQNNLKPTEYTGGQVAICCVKGDRADVLEPGDQVALRPGEKPWRNNEQYRISSEVNTGQVEVDEYTLTYRGLFRRGFAYVQVTFPPDYAVEDEWPYKGKITWFALLLAKPWAVRGKYITVMKGRDERHQIMELDLSSTES